MTICIVVHVENILVTLTLSKQCPVLNSSELFPHTTIHSGFKLIDALSFELSCAQTHRHTDGDEYSIFAVDKPNYNKAIMLVVLHLTYMYVYKYNVKW